MNNPYYHVFKKRSLLSFTLVELLVVISIIAILASLLLPALRKARMMSITTVCSGNLKQVALATSMYSDDFDDWIVQGAPSGYDDSWVPMLNLLGYIPKAKDRDSSITVCPGDTWSYGLSFNPQGDKCYFNYGINTSVAGPDWYSGMLCVKERRVSDVARSKKGLTETPLVVDHANVGYKPLIHLTSSKNNSYLSSSPPANIASRHNKGANFLYCDGHVKWVKGPYGPTGSNLYIFDPNSD